MSEPTCQLTEIPSEVQAAFNRFCKENGWTPQEILTMQMLECIKIGPDLVLQVLKQRQGRRDSVKWFTKLPYWPSDELPEE